MSRLRIDLSQLLSDLRLVRCELTSRAHQLLALTIYRPRFHLDGQPVETQRASEALLSIFNDVIQEEARVRGHGVLDLRRICVTDKHFANPIEPSDFGGREIAVEIAGWLNRRLNYPD